MWVAIQWRLMLSYIFFKGDDFKSETSHLLIWWICEIDRIAGTEKVRINEKKQLPLQQLKQGERTIPETSTVREGKTTRSSKNPLKFIVETKKKTTTNCFNF
jgi:hypothetical protein